MVVVDRAQEDQWAARRFVGSLGVSEQILSRTQMANPDVDWLRIVHALDRVFLSYGGTLAQAQFLRQVQPVLSGRTPIETLATRGGPEEVCRAAHDFAAAPG